MELAQHAVPVRPSGEKGLSLSSKIFAIYGFIFAGLAGYEDGTGYVLPKARLVPLLLVLLGLLVVSYAMVDK